MSTKIATKAKPAPVKTTTPKAPKVEAKRTFVAPLARLKHADPIKDLTTSHPDFERAFKEFVADATPGELVWAIQHLRGHHDHRMLVLRTEFKKNPDPIRLKAEGWKVGDEVLALCADGDWYNAKIKKVDGTYPNQIFLVEWDEGGEEFATKVRKRRK